MSPLLVAGSLTPANIALLDACRRVGVSARLLPPELAARRIRPGEVVLGRVDVRPTLDGCEPGLDSLRRLEDAGFIVLNRADALLAAHDKLETAAKLQLHDIPHPLTRFSPPHARLPHVEPPVVLKPRFGRWSADVVRCDSRQQLRRRFARLSRRPWFRHHGVLIQDLIPADMDMRILVAAGEVIGAISRIAPPGEWRTNVALGARRQPVVPPPEAGTLAISAAAAVGGDLVGVDLLRTDCGYIVLEVNGCVDFTRDYSLPGREIFADTVRSLLFPYVSSLAARSAASDEELPGDPAGGPH